MTALLLLASWWNGHGTKILGSVGASIPALLAIPDLIPQASQKWWLASAIVIGILTVNRGFDNNKVNQTPSE